MHICYLSSHTHQSHDINLVTANVKFPHSHSPQTLDRHCRCEAWKHFSDNCHSPVLTCIETTINPKQGRHIPMPAKSWMAFCATEPGIWNDGGCPWMSICSKGKMILSSLKEYIKDEVVMHFAILSWFEKALLTGFREISTRISCISWAITFSPLNRCMISKVLCAPPKTSIVTKSSMARTRDVARMPSYFRLNPVQRRKPSNLPKQPCCALQSNIWTCHFMSVLPGLLMSSIRKYGSWHGHDSTITFGLLAVCLFL